jgi:hypothetical protein
MRALSYPYFLLAHSYLRWVVLVLGIAAILAGLSGWNGTRPARNLRLFTVLYVIAIDLEFLIGVSLFVWLSPVTQSLFQSFHEAMKIKEPRFFGVEHSTLMLLSVICVHIGAALSRKARTEMAKARGATVAFLISLVLILAGIPWWRPLLRL